MPGSTGGAVRTVLSGLADGPGRLVARGGLLLTQYADSRSALEPYLRAGGVLLALLSLLGTHHDRHEHRRCPASGGTACT